MNHTPGAMISISLRAKTQPVLAPELTRWHYFVIFESGLQMLADNSTMYYKNEGCTEFITQVPTTWGETRALVAKVGEVAVVAKRKNDKWFIGGMTNGQQKERIVENRFLLSQKRKNIYYDLFEDGINADRQAMDYRKKTMKVKHGDAIKIKMVWNGGWAAMLE